MGISKISCENIRPPLWNDQSDFFLNEATDLWRISIKEQTSQFENLKKLLSKEELERVNRFHQQKDKIRFTLGKGTLRTILSLYLRCSPQDIRFEKGYNEKPFINYPQNNIAFNISYSHNWILIAVSSEAVGVDVEYINKEFDYSLVMENCFTEKEIKTIQSASPPENIFFRSWTRKEALLKATSLGLNDYLRDFSCLDGSQPLSKKLNITGDWFIKSFLMEGDYYVSFAQKSAMPIRYCDNPLI